MLQVQDPEQVRSDLDQHALLQSCRLNGAHGPLGATGERRRQTSGMSSRVTIRPVAVSIRFVICVPGRSVWNASSSSPDPRGRRPSTCTRRAIATCSPRSSPAWSREQIELAVEDNRLTIRGSRPASIPTGPSGTITRSSAATAHFSRTFEFGDAIDARADHRRSARRRPDGHASESPRGACRDASTCSRGHS